MRMRVKKNVLRLNKKEYKFLQYLSRNSKNLYNQTLYAVRQHYFKTGEYLNYFKTYPSLKDCESCQALPSDPAQQVMKVVDRSFRSFFALLWKKKQGNYSLPINIPKYLPKDGYFPIIFPCREGRMKDYFRTNVQKHLQKRFGIKQITFPRPECIKDKKLKEVRLLPKLNHFEIEWVYEELSIPQQLDEQRVLGIDLGVSNFATCVDSEPGHPFILDGRELKSYNRYFNKRTAKMKPKSHNKLKLFDKRRRILNNSLNQYVNFILQYVLENKIGNIIIGEGYLAPKNLGKKNNQNFVNIPFAQFIQKLKSKCEIYGIKFTITEESYTSKCDHLAKEPMKHSENYLGKRVHRGLFRSSTKVLLNADVNGALGMLLKRNHEISVKKLVNSGCLTQPRRITLREIWKNSSIQLVKKLTFQAPPLAVG